MKNTLIKWIGWVLVVLWLKFPASALGEASRSDHEIKKSPKKPKAPIGDRIRSEDPCLGGAGLASFANGEAFDLGGMVSYLAEPGCKDRQGKISREAISFGVRFIDEPFRLKQLASNYNPNSVQSSESVNQTLLRTLPVILKDHPVSNDSILPVLGQVAVLSPAAGRKLLGEMIRNELISSAPLMKESKQNKEGLASDLAQTLLMYGAKNPLIAAELSEATEEMALSAQIDSLGKILSSLAAAAQAEEELVTTLEATVDGAQKGISKGKSYFSPEDSQALLKLIFENIKNTFLSEPELDGVSINYNKAFQTLLEDRNFMRTSLREAWKECVKVLSTNKNQVALGRAVAFSITSDVIYLPDKDKELLLMASDNYLVLAIALQRSFLVAWNEAWEMLYSKKIPIDLFNSRKDRYFVPLVEGILELEPESIEFGWLKFVWEKGFVRDEQIETRFPKLVLVQVKKRENALKDLQQKSDLEDTIRAMLVSLDVSRNLSSVQVPALNLWIKKNESQKPTDSPPSQK